MSMTRQAGIILPGYNPLLVANAPTIGTATAGSSNCASVTFTAPSCTGGSVITTYTVYANCGALATTGASSPLTVTGLTAGTSYTFKVIATNIYGPSYPSAASNSIIPPQTYTTPGTYTFVVPAGVTTLSAAAIGGGGGGYGGGGNAGGGGGGGAFRYVNNISVTPAQNITVTVGAAGVAGNSATNGGQSSFGSSVVAPGGSAASGVTGGSGGTGGTGSGGDGGNGGSAGGSYGAGSTGSGGAGGAGGRNNKGGGGTSGSLGNASYDQTRNGSASGGSGGFGGGRNGDSGGGVRFCTGSLTTTSGYKQGNMPTSAVGCGASSSYYGGGGGGAYGDACGAAANGQKGAVQVKWGAGATY